MKKIRSILLYIFVPLVLIQFIPVNRENPQIDNSLVLKVPPNVEVILKNSCYDCHSNNTVWPIYSYVAPVSWLVSRDVKFGREDLNFSEWGLMTKNKQDHKKEEIIEEISRETMPMPIYLLTHPSASLSDNDKLIIKNWLTGRDSNFTVY